MPWGSRYTYIYIYSSKAALKQHIYSAFDELAREPAVGVGGVDTLCRKVVELLEVRVPSMRQNMSRKEGAAEQCSPGSTCLSVAKVPPDCAAHISPSLGGHPVTASRGEAFS